MTFHEPTVDSSAVAMVRVISRPGPRNNRRVLFNYGGSENECVTLYQLLDRAHMAGNPAECQYLEFAGKWKITARKPHLAKVEDDRACGFSG